MKVNMEVKAIYILSAVTFVILFQGTWCKDFVDTNSEINSDLDTVSFPTAHITEQPADATIPRYGTFTLACRMTGYPPPKIRWLRVSSNNTNDDSSKDSESIPQELGSSTSSNSPAAVVSSNAHRIQLPNGGLFFLRVKPADAGVYWCEAIDGRGGVVRSRNATLTVAVLRNEFREQPSDLRVQQGETGRLRCVPPRGWPTPVVSWMKEGEILELGERVRVIADQLVIISVQESDSGEYRCYARNAAGERQSRSARLDVQVAPYYFDVPNDVRVTVGGRTRLTCPVQGSPMPRVVWARAARPRGLPEGVLAVGNELHFPNATRDEAGTYLCRAINPLGELTVKITLIVMEPPKVKLRVVTNITSHSPEETKIECIGEGSPPPTLVWLSGRSALAPRLASEESSCLAVNEAGGAVAPWYLPYDSELIYLQTAEPYTKNSVKLTWEIFHDSENKFDHIFVYYRLLETNMAEYQTVSTAHFVDMQEFVVTGLRKFTMYEFFLVPFYSEGVGAPSNLIQSRTGEDAPDGPPTSIKAFAINYTAFFVSWEPPMELLRNGRVVSYRVRVLGGGEAREIEAEESKGELTVRGAGGETYELRLAAVTREGVGPFSAPIIMRLETPQEIVPEDFVSNSWKMEVRRIALLSVAAVAILVLAGTIVVLLHKTYFYRNKKSPTADLYGTNAKKGSLVQQLNIQTGVALGKSQGLTKTNSLVWSGPTEIWSEKAPMDLRAPTPIYDTTTDYAEVESSGRPLEKTLDRSRMQDAAYATVTLKSVKKLISTVGDQSENITTAPETVKYSPNRRTEESKYKINTEYKSYEENWPDTDRKENKNRSFTRKQKNIDSGVGSSTSECKIKGDVNTFGGLKAIPNQIKTPKSFSSNRKTKETPSLSFLGNVGICDIGRTYVPPNPATYSANLNRKTYIKCSDSFKLNATHTDSSCTKNIV